MKQILVPLFFLFSLASCNIYKYFDSATILEAARKCQHEGNFDCATTEYNKLTDSTVKAQKLCLNYLAQAGVSTSMLISTMQEDASQMFGTLANQMVPWSEAKTTAANNAYTQCNAYKTAVAGTTSADEGALLNAMAAFTDCAVRMAKTDQFQASDATTCDVANNTTNNNSITQADIGDATGAAFPAMCSADAILCANRTNGVAGDLSTAGLTSLNNIPAGLASANSNEAAAVASRQALRATVN